MKRIEILTDHNVAIDMDIAGLGQRIAAFILDLLFMLVIALLSLVILGGLLGNLTLYVIVVFLSVYTLFFELTLRGRTPGKWAMKIRVVDVHGRAPKGIDIFLRWVFRVVDIWFSLGTVAVATITTSPRGMRLGGMLGNTMVVREKSAYGVTLDDILTIEDRDSREPEYPMVYRFAERDMLTVKTLLQRHVKYGNAAHAELVNDAAHRCAEVLELQEPPADAFGFLQTLLRDYIILTRS